MEENNYGNATISGGVSENLTQDIATAISAGKDVTVWLQTTDASSSAPEEDKEKIEQSLPENYQIGAIIDIQLLQNITGEGKSNIYETNEQIQLRVAIPASILKDNRSYKVVRVHNGNVTILDTTRVGDDILFASNLFSTYSIIYSDEETQKQEKEATKEMPHIHVYEWGNWNMVSKEADGTKVYQCKICGHVLEKENIPAYAYTCMTEAEHVLRAPKNASVICDMGRWNVYPKWFFEKLATRPDVNITIKFMYLHKQYTVSIPAGTQIDTSCDWYGPLKITSLYEFEVK